MAAAIPGIRMEECLWYIWFQIVTRAVWSKNQKTDFAMPRLGLCCLFRDQPIKFVTTTATSIGKTRPPDALAKLSRLCMANADALLAALRFCADNRIGCFRINSQILPIKTHPACGYEIDDLPESDEIVRRFHGMRAIRSQAQAANLLSPGPVRGAEFAPARCR